MRQVAAAAVGAAAAALLAGIWKLLEYIASTFF